MNDVVVGILAVVVGLLLVFVGYRALRTMMAVVGALTGFGIGGAVAAGFPIEGTLGTIVTWIVALLVALLFGWLAYAFYQVAVLVGLASIGFSIGAGLMVALGLRGDWPVWLVGALVAVVLVVLGLIGDLPAILLIVVTGLAGANLTITGAMLLIGSVDLVDLNPGGSDVAAVGWWWALAALALAIVGIVSQLRSLSRSRAAMRAQWSAPGVR